MPVTLNITQWVKNWKVWFTPNTWGICLDGYYSTPDRKMWYLLADEVNQLPIMLTIELFIIFLFAFSLMKSKWFVYLSWINYYQTLCIVLLWLFPVDKEYVIPLSILCHTYSPLGPVILIKKI